MAQMWMRHDQRLDGQLGGDQHGGDQHGGDKYRERKWFPFALEDSAYVLIDARWVRVDDAQEEIPQAAIRCWGDESGSDWALITEPSRNVRVNAEPVELGLRVLRDRDEITFPPTFFSDSAVRCYFSTESVAVIQTMPQQGVCGVCPRCKSPIEAGSNVVRCPLCRVYHHEDEAEGACWTYDAVCANCRRQSTSLDGQLQWSPEQI